MDRKVLKQRGKALFGGNDLFKSRYWQSVLVTLFMLFNFGSFLGPKMEFKFDDIDTVFSSINDADLVTSYFINAFSGGVAVAVIISSLFSLLLSILVICTLKAGGIRYFLKLRKNNPTDFKEIFQNFKDKTFLNIGKISFCKFAFTYLWTLLFFVPGFIKSYEYWAIDYILATRPDIERQEAFRLSKTVMNGHKWDLFVLQLSFLGWDILNGFTSGLLGIFYVSPYQQATYVEFFSDIRLEALAKGIITPFDIPDYELFAPATYNYSQQYYNPANPQQNPQYYGNYAQPNQQPFTQPNPQYNPQYNQQPFAQPNQQYNPQYNQQPFAQTNQQYNPQYNQQPFAQPAYPQPPVTPQASTEMPQAPVEANNAEETVATDATVEVSKASTAVTDTAAEALDAPTVETTEATVEEPSDIPEETE